MTHKLKTWPIYFNEVVSGRKKFECRKDDRGFKLGDWLILEEYNEQKEKYTGRTAVAQVEYILSGEFGIMPGYVVMSIRLYDRTQL